MSIGQGHVGQRKSRHLGVFRNGGVDMISPNGHVSPSQTGKKMFAFDSNIDNWHFSYCLVPNKSICKNYAFDVTPSKYITKIITEKKIVTPNKISIKKLIK